MIGRAVLVPISVRIAAASTVAAIVLLGGAGLIFLTTLRSGLEGGVDSSLRSSVNELSTRVTAHSGSAASLATSKLQLADNTFGQVFAADGSVLASTDDRFVQPLLTPNRVAAASASSRFFSVSLQQVGNEKPTQDERVLAAPVGSGGLVVAVALSRDTADDPVDRAGKQLLVLGAVVVLVAAGGSWLLARAALRPVDRMSALAAELEARDAGAGLDVPVSPDEIGRLGVTLNALLARLHSALERERAFVADAGHELRTPLTVLRGELELARRPGRTRDELMETVNVASEETERLIRLAEDLLVLARDEDTASVRWRHFDLAGLIGDAVSLVESMAQSRSISIVQQVKAEAATSGDPIRIRQAVDNVLANALRYSPPGSQIEIRVGVCDGRTQIEVLDEGPGFSAELLPVAFERFRREDKVRTRDRVRTRTVPDSRSSAEDYGHAGSGLGLAIVRTVLRSHGGDAFVANRTDRSGARVRLSWPGSAATNQ